ncbi:MAG: RagB/SusD family nutrient uptake outer membrane protein [Chitinophagaceae bacterium]
MQRYSFIYKMYTRLFIVLILHSSCKKFLDIAPNPNQVTTDQVFSNDKTALSAMSGIYTQLLNNLSLTSAGTSVYAGLCADEIYNTRSNATDDPFYTNSLLADNNTVNLNFYRFGYKVIYQANSILSGLEKSTGVSETVKQQLTGEAKVCRAFLYFYLVNLFGDVPLITTTGYEENARQGRSAVGSIYEQMEKDLKEAQQVLPSNYPSANKGRPNKWVATALLARVYAYEQKWPEAETEAMKVITQGSYQLNNDLNSVFLTGNKETIWELTGDRGNAAEGVVFIPFLFFIPPSYNLSPSLVNAFETNDQRRTSWVKTVTLNGVTYQYPFKYKIETQEPMKEKTNLLRLAEQLLIAAEAMAKQNKLNESKDRLNLIRNRAGLDNTTATDQTSLLSAIEQERRIEFFCEWGHRWMDLKRTGRAEEVLSPIKGNKWQGTDVLWPIPYSELQLNTALTQNPGY